MKDFDFRDSTQKKQPKKPTVTNKHIEATRKTNPRRTRRFKQKPQQQEAEVVKETFLTTKISENYEGKIEGIIAYISTLPKHLQKIINFNPIKSVVARQGYTMYVIKGGYTLKITETKLGNKHKLLVEFKEKKKRTLTKYI